LLHDATIITRIRRNEIFFMVVDCFVCSKTTKEILKMKYLIRKRFNEI